MQHQANDTGDSGDESDDDASEILSDIQEALSLAQLQGVLPPVRIARILAGEGTGQFSSAGVAENSPRQRTVPLSVALDYVGAILDESRKEISRLKVRNSCIIRIFRHVDEAHSFLMKSEVEEYNQLCNSMETEVESLLRASQPLSAPKGTFFLDVVLVSFGGFPSLMLRVSIRNR